MRDARENRMNVLANNGIDTSKFFTISLDKDVLNKGVALKLNGNELTAEIMNYATESNVPAEEVEELKRTINENGMVACTKLYRRWICAQMLRIQYEIEKGKYRNIEEKMRTFDIKYMTDVLMNEYNALDKIVRENDWDSYGERHIFYTPNAVVEMYHTWYNDLYKAKLKAKKHIQNRNHWGAEQKEYIKLGTRYKYTNDIDNDLSELFRLINGMRSNPNPFDMMNLMRRANAILVPCRKGSTEAAIQYTVPKAFMFAYKDSGAYYTLKNLVLFHKGFYLTHDITGEILTRTEAFEYLKTYLKNVKNGDGYMLYALMRKAIADNGVSIRNLF